MKSVICKSTDIQKKRLKKRSNLREILFFFYQKYIEEVKSRVKKHDLVVEEIGKVFSASAA